MEIQADFRLLCATHADLPRAIEERSFRHDLYYRINTVQVMLPPLRERREDIPLLVAHFLERFSAKMRKEVRSVSLNALQQLREHPWPGNVRELEHVIERAVALATGEIVERVAFPPPPDGAATASETHSDGSTVAISIGTTVDEAALAFVRGEGS